MRPALAEESINDVTPKEEYSEENVEQADYLDELADALSHLSDARLTKLIKFEPGATLWSVRNHAGSYREYTPYDDAEEDMRYEQAAASDDLDIEGLFSDL